MPARSVTVSSQTTSNVLTIDLRRYKQGVGLLLAINGTLTATVQVTGDNVQADGYTPATGNWFAHDGLSAKTTSSTGNLAFPVTAVRLNVTSWTNGSTTLAVVQSED